MPGTRRCARRMRKSVYRAESGRVRRAPARSLGRNGLSGDARGRLRESAYRAQHRRRRSARCVRGAARAHSGCRQPQIPAAADGRVDHRHVYDIPYGERNIWGATAGMLHDLAGGCCRRAADTARDDGVAAARAARHHGSACAPRTAAPGIVSKPSRVLRLTPSRKPTKSPTPSSVAIFAHLKDELGDLLFQVVFHAQMAREAGAFRFRVGGGGDLRQAAAAPSACLRRRRAA